MKFIIPILVGSAIGYLTNLLAIKMLFRPLEEKRILGVRIPFTPGLIPKERKRIARSIGEAVGDHLLTSEKITKIVSGEETKKRLESFVIEKVDKLKKSNSNLKELLASLGYKLPKDKISKKLYSLLVGKLNEQATKDALGDVLKEEIYPEYKNRLIEKISKDGEDFIQKLKGSEPMENFMIEDINYKLNRLKNTDIILSDILDNSTIEKLEKLVEENEEEIMDGIRRLFYKEDTQEAILDSIEDLVDQNLSKMITMFIDSKAISIKILQVIKGYVDSKESEKAVSLIIRDTIQNIMDTKVSAMTNKGLNVINKDDILSIYKFALDSFASEENIGKLISAITSSIDSKDEIVKIKIDTYLKGFIKDISDSKRMENAVRAEIERIIDIVLEMPFSLLLKDLSQERIGEVFNFIYNIVNVKFKESLYEIVNLFDVAKEVEDEINSFDIEYTEELILNIAEKELKAITRLGALLGAIMGFITPLLQMI